MSHIVDNIALRNFCTNVYVALGMPYEDAYVVADSLVDADLSGVSSHGVSRMKIYSKRLETGVVKTLFSPAVLNESAATLTLDANNGMGIVSAKYAADRTIEKAKESGCCFTTVRGSNHFGTASYFARMIADAGMIGFVSTNAPPNIAPTGSYRPYMGTNPIAIAAPTLDQPVVLDMAPSVVAMGKVILAAKEGKPIPEGWALTADGKPTTNASEGVKGTVVPIGGPKGYGLAFFVDVLCGILSGAQFGPHLGNMFNDFVNPQNVGHVFMAIDITRFCSLDAFCERLSGMIAEIKALPKIEGVSEIFVPGEIEQRKRTIRLQEGIELPDVVYDELKELAERYRVEFTI